MLFPVEPPNPERAAWIQAAIEKTEAWVASAERSIEADRFFLTPGDPDDDWDYDHIAGQKAQIQAARRVLDALAAELRVAQESAEALRRLHRVRRRDPASGESARQAIPPERWIPHPVSDHGDLDRPEPRYERRREEPRHLSLESPAAQEIELPFRPLLESWERGDHPAQLKLREYRDRIGALAAPALTALELPLGVAFHVGGREDAVGGDLDNFLTPLMKALGGGAAFSLVAATRGRADEVARLTLARAADFRLAMDNPCQLAARLSVSPTQRAWKEHLAAAVGRHASANAEGAVELGLRFRVSPKRNWVTLWKPAIDALGGILGEGARPWHPRDDRISLLVLERELAPELGWDIDVTVSWAVPGEAQR